MQVSQEASSWLIFPLNFEIVHPQLHGHERLLRLFLSVTFQSLEYSSLRMLPYLDSFRKWFILSSFGASLPPPKDLETCPFLKIGDITSLAHNLHQSLIADKDNSLTEFVSSVFSFPQRFAIALGLKGVIFVLDAFDYTNVVLDPSDAAFGASLKSVRLSDALSLALNDSPYIISLKNERDFLECFAGSNAALLTTEGVIQAATEQEIVVRNPALRIRIEDCRGCPGFVVAFKALVARIKAAGNHAAYPSPYSRVNTAADLSRQKVIRLELVHLVGLLMAAGIDEFPREIVNELGAASDLIVRLGPELEVEAEKEAAFSRASGDV
jgi:hypothetical protein